MSLRKRFKSAIQAFRFTPTDVTRLGGSYFVPQISLLSTAYNPIDYLMAYMEIPEVNAVINRKALMWSSVPLRIVSKTTGKDYENRQDLVKLLRNPNWYQSQKEFMFQTKIFREIYGNEFLYFDKWAGAPYREAKALYTLPALNVKVTTPQDKPFFMYQTPVVDYSFRWKGDLYPLPTGSVIQFNDNRAAMNPDAWVTGESKLEPLKVILNNLRAAHESRNSIIRYRGAVGFISPEQDRAGALPFGKGDKEAIQDEWRNYGTGREQHQFAFSPVPIKFQAIGVNDPAKLGLFAESEFGMLKICDSFGLDRDMFGSEKGATFENKKQGERASWNNTIIPEKLEWVDGLNDTYNTAPESWKIVADFAAIAVLQENIAEKGEAIKSITDSLSLMLSDRIITPEDYQKELNKLGLELTTLPSQTSSQP